MVKTASIMLPLGTQAPEFSLPDVVSGKLVHLHSKDTFIATVVFFICNHCPFVKHINDELTRIATDYQTKNVRFLAINSNDVEHYPEDSPEKMIETALQHRYPFPYLYDETQEVAKAYQAACTPDFYVFNKALNLVYRGQLDDSRPGNNIPPNGHSIRHALDSLINNKHIVGEQKPSIGCNIKWKK